MNGFSDMGKSAMIYFIPIRKNSSNECLQDTARYLMRYIIACKQLVLSAKTSTEKLPLHGYFAHFFM